MVSDPSRVPFSFLRVVSGGVFIFRRRSNRNVRANLDAMKNNTAVVLLGAVLLVVVAAAATEETVTLVMKKTFRGMDKFVTNVRTLRANPQLSMQAGGTARATLACMDGDTIVSGGCQVNQHDQVHIVVRASYPLGEKWVCEWANLSATDSANRLPRTMHAVCVTIITSTP